MIKVHTLTTCKHCNGEAYVPAGEAESYNGDRYTSYQPCLQHNGNGTLIILIPKQAKTLEFVPLPHLHPRPVLQRLRQVGRLDQTRSRQIGDGARQFEHAVVGTRREL